MPKLHPIARTVRATSVLALLAGLMGPGIGLAAPRPRDVDPMDAAVAKALEEQKPLIAVVSIHDQHVTLWAGDTVVARAPVSTGMEGHRTPLGVFSVIGKERYHESNIYSGAPMPFMQRITWSGIAMHAGNLPGYPASHGCIRMPDGFAQRLFGMTKVGMRVIVTKDELKPDLFANALLPNPTFSRVSEIVPQAQGAGKVSTAAAGDVTGRMQLGGPTEADDRLLNPMERGKLEQVHIKNAALDAQNAVQALVQIAAEWSHDAGIAADEARAAASDRQAAMMRVDSARRIAQDAALAEDVRKAAEAAVPVLEEAAKQATLRHEQARRAADAADAAAFASAAEAKAAIAESDELAAAARIAVHATEPISIFVSRKERRVYARQGFQPVFEADIEIADPDASLGTHVFTAIGASQDGGELQWVRVSVPSTPGRDDEGGRSRVTKVSLASDSAVTSPTAATALSRIKFSDDVAKAISRRLWIGASLIISDYGTSHETGEGTDFIVLTR